MMRHANCRSLVAAGEITAEVEAHLEACGSCRAHADRIDRIRALAPSIGSRAGTGPSDLADRVIGRVWAGGDARPGGAGAAGGAGAVAGAAVTAGGAEPAGADVVTLSETVARRPIAQRPVLASLSIAAAALVVAGAVALVSESGTGETLEVQLAAAAEATASLETYRIAVDGTSSITVTLPEIPVPDLTVPTIPTIPTLPAPELPTISIPVPDFEGMPPEVRARMEQSLAEAQARMDQHRLSRPELPEVPTPDLGSLERQLAELPRELTTEITFTGTGEVVRPDRLHLATDVEVRHEPAGLVDRSATELVAVGDEAWLRTGGGRWMATPLFMGPLGPVLLDVDAVAGALEAAAASEDLGTETLDGVEVRHLRLTTPVPFVGDLPPAEEYSVDAWIDADDVVRQVRFRLGGSVGAPEAPGVRWSSETMIRLFDFGAEVTVSPPPADQVDGAEVAVDGPLVFAFPFHVHVTMTAPVAAAGLVFGGVGPFAVPGIEAWAGSEIDWHWSR